MYSSLRLVLAAVGRIQPRSTCLQARSSLVSPPHFPCSNVWLTSEQHLDLNFNPASLLSVGDALAFMRRAQGEHC